MPCCSRPFCVHPSCQVPNGSVWEVPAWTAVGAWQVYTREDRATLLLPWLMGVLGAGKDEEGNVTQEASQVLPTLSLDADCTLPDAPNQSKPVASASRRSRESRDGRHPPLLTCEGTRD